ncbi:MAG: hypothetical protein U1F28_06595 [Acinetobacter sp.]
MNLHRLKPFNMSLNSSIIGCALTTQQVWSFEQIFKLIEKQILNTPASSFLIEQIAEHIRFALIHPRNEQTKIER